MTQQPHPGEDGLEGAFITHQWFVFPSKENVINQYLENFNPANFD